MNLWNAPVLFVVTAAIFWMTPASVLAEAPASAYPSPLALCPVGAEELAVIEHGTHRLSFLETVKGTIRKSVTLEGAPHALIPWRKDRILVASGFENGRIAALSIETGAIEWTLEIGHTPSAMTIIPGGNLLAVCNRFSNELVLVDLDGRKIISRIPVGREPMSIVASPSGQELFIAQHLPSVAATASHVAATITVVRLKDSSLSTISLPNGAHSLKNLALSPDGLLLFVPYTLARFQLPTSQVDRGWMNSAALTLIDLKKESVVATIPLDDPQLGAANPWDVAFADNGKTIVVSHAGTHEISLIGYAQLFEKLKPKSSSDKNSKIKSAADTYDDLSMISDFRRRVPLKGKGPKGLAVIGRKIFVAEYFTNSVGVMDLSDTSSAPPRSLPLGSFPENDAPRQGELYFYDAEFCYQKWQSCSSCHPDARVDGFNWDLFNDGVGNPKNTKTMLLAHKTPPAMISGIRGSAEIAVRAGFRFIQFSSRSEEETSAVDAYLKSMSPVASPFLIKGKLSASAERGQEIFNKMSCSSCHPKPLYTDLHSYDLGTAQPNDKVKKLDTPTLIEVWRTAPYFFDGRAANLHEALSTPNQQDLHRVSDKLSKSELDDLVEYLLSL